MGILLILFVALFLSAPDAVARSRSGGGGGVSAIVWNNRGVDLYSAGRYQAAIEAYDKAIKINPRYTDAYSNRGVAYDAMDQPERAVIDYSHAISLNPSLTASYVNRGLAYTDLAKYKEAIADWNVVLRRNPRNSDAYYRRGFCYQSSASLDKALADYERACKLNPRFAKAVRGRDMMRKALAIAPGTTSSIESSFTPLPMEKQPALMSSDEQSKVARRRDRDAMEAPNMVPDRTAGAAAARAASSAGTRARAIGPAAYCVTVLHHIIGNALLATHQYEAAANTFSGALNVNANDHWAYFRRGNAYLSSGNKSLALADYQRALAIDPGFKPAQAKVNKLTGEMIR